MNSDRPHASVAASAANGNPLEVGSILFTGLVSASSVEDLYAEWTNSSTADAVCFDLHGAVHFEIAGLLRLLSLVAQRQSERQATIFRLPDDAAARHILRLWRFPPAVSELTRTPFRLLVVREDWVHFGEAWPRPRVSEYAATAGASVLAYLLERRSFGLQAYSGARLDEMVAEQTAHWSGYALANLLETVLHVPAAELARGVVRGLLSGLLSTADPRTVVVGSQLDLVSRKESGTQAGLTIAAWHDGRSIIDHVAASASRPKAADEEDGFGALARTAIETYQGTVAVRGGRASIAMERAGGRTRVKTRVSDLPMMVGDVVTVRLPIHDG